MALRVLIVGFGYAAKTFHVPFLTTMREFSITGVVSSDPAKVQKVISNPRVFSTLEQALATDSYDLVIITTPNHLHAQQAEAAMRAGSNVLVEKPFTLCSQSAQQLVDLASELDKQLCVFHNRRFDGDFLTLKKLIGEGAVGTVKRLESRFDRFRPEPRKRWRENAGPGSGIFWDLGPHLIDQVLQLFGEPTDVSACVQTLREGGEADDAFEVSLHYPNRIVLVGSSPFEAGPTLRYALQGTAGSYRKYYLDPQEEQLKSGMLPGDADWAVTPVTQRGMLFTESEQAVVETLPGGYTDFYTQLAAALLAGSGTPLPADASSVVAVIKIIELARAASEQQKTLTLNAFNRS